MGFGQEEVYSETQWTGRATFWAELGRRRLLNTAFWMIDVYYFHFTEMKSKGLAPPKAVNPRWEEAIEKCELAKFRKLVLKNSRLISAPTFHWDESDPDDSLPEHTRRQLQDQGNSCKQAFQGDKTPSAMSQFPQLIQKSSFENDSRSISIAVTVQALDVEVGHQTAGSRSRLSPCCLRSVRPRLHYDRISYKCYGSLWKSDGFSQSPTCRKSFILQEEV